MGRKKTAAYTPRYRPDKISIGVELVGLPPAMPEVKKDKKANQFYEYLGGELITSGKLATTDIFCLQLYCLELADYFAVRAQLDGEWIADGSMGNEVINPLARLMESKLTSINRYAKELGLTPHSRGLVGKVTQVSLPTGGGGESKGRQEADLDLD